jgi:hypothetical protein
MNNVSLQKNMYFSFPEDGDKEIRGSVRILHLKCGQCNAEHYT